MDNGGSVIVCQLLFTFQISFNSSPGRPASLERACNLCRPDWLGQGMPGVDDTNYKTKASFHPSFRLLWPSLANTSHSVNTRWNFTRFYICADMEWWRDIQILFVTSDGWGCQDCDRPLITGDKLCLHLHWGVITRRYYANQWLSFKKLSSSAADIHECWRLTLMTPPHGWWSGDGHCNLIRYCPESVPVITHPLASPHQFYVSVWCLVQMLRKERGVGTRNEEREVSGDHLGEMPSLMTQRWDLSEHNG